MSLQHAYAVTNLLTGLAEGSFSWTPSTTTLRSYLNDGAMDARFSVVLTASTVIVEIDLGSAKNVSAIALLNSNIASATAPTVTIQAADNAGFSVGAVTPKATTTLALTPAPLKDHVLQFAAVSKQYWRITWAWTGSFALTIGELFFASTTALTRYVVYGHGRSAEYVNARLKMYAGGSRAHYIAGPIATRKLPWADLSESERNELLVMAEASKSGATPMLWCEQYEAVATAADAAHQACIFGRIEEDQASWTEDDYGIYQPSALTIRSLGREVGA